MPADPATDRPDVDEIESYVKAAIRMDGPLLGRWIEPSHVASLVAYARRLETGLKDIRTASLLGPLREDDVQRHIDALLGEGE